MPQPQARSKVPQRPNDPEPVLRAGDESNRPVGGHKRAVQECVLRNDGRPCIDVDGRRPIAPGRPAVEIDEVGDLRTASVDDPIVPIKQTEAWSPSRHDACLGRGLCWLALKLDLAWILARARVQALPHPHTSTWCQARSLTALWIETTAAMSSTLGCHPMRRMALKNICDTLIAVGR